MMNLLLAAILACAMVRADDFSKIEVKATPLGESVYMLEGAGGNITALIGPDGTLLVDDDFAPMAEKLVAKLRELKGDSPRFIVNTHFHYDHTGGNEVFGKTATIFAASAVRERLSSEQVLWHEVHAPEPEQARPAVTYTREFALHLNGESIRVLHLPSGHPDGDSVVFFANAHVVALGDLYFAGMYPIFHPEHKGSLHGFLANLELLLKRIPADAYIVPGHGPLSRKPDLERYIHMIQASVATVKRDLAQGLTLEQVQKKGLPKEWEDFSHGYLKTDQWLKLVYQELANCSSPGTCRGETARDQGVRARPSP